MNGRLPVVRGVITRRLLVNYRVDPAALRGQLPPPFRPQLVGGYAVGGICLIRLDAVRPRGLPGCLGLGSENAAHRIAVEWDEAGQIRTGVFIPRRDTDSALNQALGGRLFPGCHQRADFAVNDDGTALRLGVVGRDGELKIEVAGRAAAAAAPGSVFPTLAAASEFFRQGALGWSPTKTGGCEGLELRCDAWAMQPFAVAAVASSYFDDPHRFPPGAAAFDGAFIMRNITHEWHACGWRREGEP